MKKIAVLLAALLVFSTLTVVVSASELTNVALNKSYTTELVSDDATEGYGVDGEDEGAGDGVDGVRQRLTDGVVITNGDGGFIPEGEAAPYAGAQEASEVVYVIDLESVVSGITKFKMDLYANTSWGIQFPESVEYSISDDNVTFTSLGVVEADESRYTEGNEGWEYWTMDLDLTESASARYVKITAKAGNYVWSSEIEVLADLSGGSDEDPAEEPDEDPDDETPQTSDNILFLIAVLTVSLSGAVVITRKKRSA